MSDIFHMYENERKTKFTENALITSANLLLLLVKKIYFLIFILQVCLVKYIFRTRN